MVKIFAYHLLYYLYALFHSTLLMLQTDFPINLETRVFVDALAWGDNK